MSRQKKGGCFSYILVAVIAAAAAIVISHMFEEQDTFITDTDIDGEPSFVVSGGEYTTYYEQLNGDEQKIYNALMKGVPDGKTDYSFPDVDYEAYKEYCERALYAFTNDHPEYFWVPTWWSVGWSREMFAQVGDVEFSVLFYEYWDYTIDQDKKIRELQDAVSRVADKARAYGTAFEQVRFVHDYLVENAIYDHDGLKEYYKSIHDPSCEYIFSAYGCLVNGKTVCSGYAKAFQLIMRELGYDCMYVTGDAGEAHGWNVLFVEDEGYFMDITWDDLDSDHDGAQYEYFCITGDALAKTHTLDPDFEIPACTATEYNYFVHENCLFDTYGFDEVSDAICRQAGSETFSVQFTSLAQLEKAYKDLVERAQCFRIPVLKDHELSYYLNEDHCTITFYIK